MSLINTLIKFFSDLEETAELDYRLFGACCKTLRTNPISHALNLVLMEKNIDHHMMSQMGFQNISKVYLATFQ